MVLPRTILVEIALVEITESLTRLRVEFAIQRISLTIGRGEVCTTDRSNAIVGTSDDLTTDLDVDQPRSSIDKQAIVVQLVRRSRSKGESIPLISPEDHSLI